MSMLQDEPTVEALAEGASGGPEQPVRPDPRRVTLDLLAQVFGDAPPPDLTIRLWDGTRWPAASADTRSVTIVLNRPGALRRMLLPPTERAIGEAYIRGDFEIEGEIETAYSLKDALNLGALSPRQRLAIVQLLRQLPTEPVPLIARPPARLRGLRHTRERDREAVQYHYDASNEFYALWLDRRMIYSCAYFETGTEDLDTAQEAKLDLICRKLRLRPGERLLDVGCGWGGLVRFAAERYGVEAIGVTLSEKQAALAQAQLAASDVADRARVLLRDYRDLRPDQPFDKIVSVGMFEHVGRARLPEYFRTLYDLLQPRGLFLNHGIADRGHFMSLPRRLLERALTDRASFVQQYVFPDGELVPISEALGIAERAGWEVRDVESLREHYAQTLRHWYRRLTARRAEAERLAGIEPYRIWRLYLAGCAYNFAHGNVSIYQSLLAKPDAAGVVTIPPTRADIYRHDGT